MNNRLHGASSTSLWKVLAALTHHACRFSSFAYVLIVSLCRCADAYDPTVGQHGGFRQGRGFRHPMAHPDIERSANGPAPRTVRDQSTQRPRVPEPD